MALLLLKAFNLLQVGLLVLFECVLLVLHLLKLAARALALGAGLQEIDGAAVLH